MRRMSLDAHKIPLNKIYFMLDKHEMKHICIHRSYIFQKKLVIFILIIDSKTLFDL